MHKLLFTELLGGLGDVLIALPAIQALTAAHPQGPTTVFLGQSIFGGGLN